MLIDIYCATWLLPAVIPGEAHQHHLVAHFVSCQQDHTCMDDLVLPNVSSGSRQWPCHLRALFHN